MPKTHALITDDQQLVSATYRSRYEIRTYDDGFGPLFISRNSIGINGIVRAKTWEDAYGICEDEFFPEADESVEEMEKEFGENWSENQCWNEQYGFRNNGPRVGDKLNHGIYSKDLNGDYLDVLTEELAEELGITVEVKDWE